MLLERARLYLTIIATYFDESVYIDNCFNAFNVPSFRYLPISSFQVSPVGCQDRCALKLAGPRSRDDRRLSSGSVVHRAEVDGAAVESSSSSEETETTPSPAQSSRARHLQCRGVQRVRRAAEMGDLGGLTPLESKTITMKTRKTTRQMK